MNRSSTSVCQLKGLHHLVQVATLVETLRFGANVTCCFWHAALASVLCIIDLGENVLLDQ